MALSQINSNSIANNAIVVADIADGSVTSAKLEANIAITGNLTVDSTTLRVDSVNNRVGVGTATPTVTLDVFSGTNPELRLTSTSDGFLQMGMFTNGAYLGTSSSDSVDGVLRLGTNNAERIRITNTGEVGVGITEPTSYGVLVVKRDQSSDTAITVSNQGVATSNTTMSFSLNEAGTSQGWLRRYRDGSGATEIGFSNSLLFTGNVTSTKVERMRIDSSGNLLVGITSPIYGVAGNIQSFGTNNITVGGNSTAGTCFALRTINNATGVTVGSITYGANFTSYNTSSASGFVGVDANTVAINTNSAERMRINASGNVGIGTTVPLGKLDVWHGGSSEVNLVNAAFKTVTPRAGGQLNFRSGGDAGERSVPVAAIAGFDSFVGSDYRGEMRLYTQINNTLTERMRITATGLVGIGTTTPTTTLDVNGTINAPNESNFTVTSLTRASVRPSLLLDFANTETLDPRITFTRASSATYYDGKTVAKAEENLLIYSQEFDNANWPKYAGTVTANSTTAPDGTTTADTFTCTAVNDAHTITQTLNLVNGATYAVSIFAKVGTHSFIQFGFSSQGGSFANFNLSTGATGTSSGVISSSITSVGSGWYRCQVIYTTSVSATGFAVAIVPSASATRFQSLNANGTETVFLWGVQLEQRSSVTAYTATTTAPITNYIPVLLTAGNNVARFEHNPVTGESLGLEIEEQRTNLITYSDNFSDASWGRFPTANTSVTSNTIISPDGMLTGDLISGTSAPYEVNKSFTKASSAITYTLSSYLKAGATTIVQFTMSDNATGQALVGFNLTTGVISSGPSNGTWSSSSATITSVGNGWYRCTLTATSPTNTGLLPTIVGTTIGNFYVWGAQLEVGAFATSYIPTVASQVTRSADSATMTGTNFSSWYRVDEGAFYAEATTNDVTGTGSRILWARNTATGTYDDSIQFDIRRGNGLSVAEFRTNNVQQAGLGMNISSGSVKVAMSYKTNDFSASLNGAAVVTDASGIVPSVNAMNIGSHIDSTNLNGTIRKIAYYPKRLTNAELQGITS